MPAAQFGLSAFERGRGDLPALPVVNMFAEAVPTEKSGVVLQSRAGLSDRAQTLGVGPVRQVFKESGVLGGRLFSVSSSGFYDDGVLIGTIDGDGPVSMDAYEDLLFIAAGSGLYSYNGATLASVSFPDGANVTKVLVGASRAICLRADTETYYWSNVLSSTISGLSFSSAESQPDQLLDALFMDDILILFGAGTVEFHPNTQDANLPFAPLEGRVFERGIRATGCATKVGSTFAWVTDVNQVCIGDPEAIVSNAGLEALIGASANVSLWTFTLEGTEFLALRIDGATWVYSMRSRMWSQFYSYGQDNWVAQCFSGDVFGSAVDGKTLAWGAAHQDLGGVLERRFRAGFPLNSGGVVINNVALRTNPGQTPFLTGDYDTPMVEMRQSRDGGQTWGNWRQTSLGAQGEYRKKVQWTACGMAGQPSWLAEFRVTDPVPFRVSGVFVNEPWGGI